MNVPDTRNKGFTVIELLVVIIIVCILALFVGVTHSGVQAKNRNVERQNDVDTLKTQLENYYAENNIYPTRAELNSTNWRAQNLKHVSEANIQDPRWNKNVKGCTTDNQAVTTNVPSPDCYSYQVTGSDGSACNNTTVDCAHYTLTATLEGGQKYVKSSLN